MADVLNRRELLTALSATLVAPTVARAWPTQTPAGVDPIYVSPQGADTDAGTKQSPIRSLAEAARRVNLSTGSGPLTVVLSEGIHVVGETTRLSPKGRTFSRTARLTIRAEVLPDDPAWHTGRMPTLIHTMPLPPTWNGRPDPLGGAADGFMIEASHVTIQGLKFLGMPVVETPQAGLIHRLYGISRLQNDLDDLEIGHCMFLGDDLTNPLHVAIIARGNGLNLHHSVFRGVKISAVYWSGGSSGHVMHHCVCDGVYGSGVWTAGITADLDYHHNVIMHSNYVWTYQGGASAAADAGGRGGRAGGASAPTPVVPATLTHYRVLDSYFAANRRLSGSGTGARLEYQDIDASFLDLTRTTVTDETVAIERDQTRRDYLHPVRGSAAARVGAGLFTTPVA